MRIITRLAVALSVVGILPTPGLGQLGERSLTVSGHYAFETGEPFSAIQTVALRTVEVTVAFRVYSGSAWTVDIPVSVVPVAWVIHNAQDSTYFRNGRWWIFNPARATSHGVGVKPIGVRLGRSIGANALQVGLSGGLVHFDRPTPSANSSRLNALGDLDLELRVPLHGRVAGIVGYRFSHISNARTGAVNPAIDSHMLSLGIQR